MKSGGRRALPYAEAPQRMVSFRVGFELRTCELTLAMWRGCYQIRLIDELVLSSFLKI